MRLVVLNSDLEPNRVALCRYTLMPIDDCLHALRATIIHLTHSGFHRLFRAMGLAG